MNIFEGAKFGDKFKTRDGRCALYLHKCIGALGEINAGHHIVVYTDADVYADNGKLWKYKDVKGEDFTDIVGKWEETINETDLDELAEKYCEQYSFEDEWEYLRVKGSFKEGYKTAKGEK